MGFIWSYPEVSYIILGIKNERQLDSHISAASFEFEYNLKKQCEDLYDDKISPLKLNW